MRKKKYLLLFILSQFLIAGEIRDKTENEIQKLTDFEASLKFQKLPLEAAKKTEIEKIVRQRFFRDYIYVWKLVDADSVKGYAVLDNVYGKAMPITFMVILDTSGTVKEARIIKYRESIGGQVSNLSWLNQFTGKNNTSDFKPGEDIDAISGATISVNALTKGLKKIVLLFPYIKKSVN